MSRFHVNEDNAFTDVKPSELTNIVDGVQQLVESSGLVRNVLDCLKTRLLRFMVLLLSPYHVSTISYM